MAKRRARPIGIELAGGGIRVRPWMVRHLQSGFATLGSFARAPIATGLTAAVIGIALALPCALYLLLDNALRLTRGWDGAAQISLFLIPELDDGSARRFGESLRRMPEVAEVRVVTREEARDAPKPVAAAAPERPR